MSSSIGNLFNVAASPLYRSKSQQAYQVEVPNRVDSMKSQYYMLPRASPQTPSRTESSSQLSLETSVAPQMIAMTTPRGTGTSFSNMAYSASPTSISSPRYHSRQTSAPAATSGSPVPRSVKRKPSKIDLPRQHMATVQEFNVDSPTIPGRHPTPISRSSPTRSPLSSHGSLTPRAMASDPELIKPAPSNLPASLAEQTSNRPYPRRSSSVLLPKGLAPIIIPSNDECILPASAYRPQTPEKDELGPPRVPPKSPRMLSKAFTHSRSNTVSTKSSRTTMQSNNSTNHTANSSVSSVASINDAVNRASKPWTPSRSSSKTSPRSPPHQLPALSASPPEMSANLPWTMKEYRSGPAKPRSNTTNVDERPNKKLQPKIVRPPSIFSHHRGASEGSGSVINRGRPMKRGDISLQRGLSRQIKASVLTNSFNELPIGYRSARAMEVLSVEELQNLRKHAEKQAASFRTLKESSVEELTEELRILEKRIEHLRKTCTSLREGRRNLHARMLASLNSPSQETFSREQVLKQAGAISELDASIDEWTVKLEETCDRKVEVQAKLFEHVASVLALKIPGSSHLDMVVSDPSQTPPHSPGKVHVEKLPDSRSFSTERRDVESIRVYADEGVATLLASIEQEIDMLELLGGYDAE